MMMHKTRMQVCCMKSSAICGSENIPECGLSGKGHTQKSRYM